MSSSPFTADMETVEGHVPTASRFISPKISTKSDCEQFPPNGLTGRSQQEANPQEDKSMNVIVCSEQAKTLAENLKDEIQRNGYSASLLCVTEAKDLKEKIQLESVESLYMMVDASLFDLLFEKRQHRGFQSDVNYFMDAKDGIVDTSVHWTMAAMRGQLRLDTGRDYVTADLEDRNKSITIFNKMEKGDDRFMKLFHQLPKSCARIFSEITIESGKATNVKEKFSTSVDSGKADLSLTEDLKQNSAGKTSGNKEKDGPPSKQSAKTDPRSTGPGGDNQEVKDVTFRKVAGLMTSAPADTIDSQGSSGFDGEGSHEGEAEVMSEDEMELEQNDNESLSEESAESDDEPESNVEVNTVQIGYNQTLELQWTAGQMVNASQDGWNNTMEINIVPPATKSKVIVVFTTNPRDERLDNLLVKEFTDETELINVRVESSDASHYKVRSGSVVMEIEVKPGVTIDKEYIEKLLKVIFSGKAGKVIPEGTKFGVDIQTKMVVPFEQLGKYVHLNPEKIHENCVSKEKYEERVKEVSQLQKRLVHVHLNPEKIHENCVSKEKVNKNMNVIVFSEPAQSSAEALQDQMKKENHSVSLLCLREPKDLKEEINLDSVSSLYMMVDASLCDILFQRKIHRGLHPDVYDFLDEVEEEGRSITLFNRMDKGDSRFKKLYHHLPEKCATMVKEITFQTGKAKKESL